MLRTLSSLLLLVFLLVGVPTTTEAQTARVEVSGSQTTFMSDGRRQTTFRFAVILGDIPEERTLQESVLAAYVGGLRALGTEYIRQAGGSWERLRYRFPESENDWRALAEDGIPALLSEEVVDPSFGIKY